MSKEFDLDLAYEINGVEDAKRVYSDWAESYEGSLVDEMGYVAPRKIAEIYIENTADKSPVLDIGAGTGRDGTVGGAEGKARAAPAQHARWA